jgi:hypothetical protein
MPIRFSSSHKLLLLLLLFIPAEPVFASEPTPMAAESALEGGRHQVSLEPRDLSTANGLLMLDYEVIPVPGNQSLDLLGFHYLHQLNRWLYLGLGLHGPMVYGNYGGFMAVDATIHAQQRLFGHTFIDAGASVGGGGGGSSIQQSKELSGRGGFIKSYVGLGYDFPGFSAGLNYTHFRFMNSLIHHSQLDVFVQKAVSFPIGPYAYSGHQVASDGAFPEAGENILTTEFNNIFQINPKGSNKKTIHTLSLQFSHFMTGSHYLFVDVDVGYKGLPLYNQALGGIGYRLSVSPRVNAYGQIGIGSGGYTPPVIDTASGLLVYPKLSVEYLWNRSLGLSLSGGYLFAPRGTSKNFTLGAAVNYHLSAEGNEPVASGNARGLLYRGFRVHVFQQTEFDVRFGNIKHGNIGLLSTQFDYLVNDHWYVPTQVSVAYGKVLGFAGYGEVLTGLGVQSRFSEASRFQNFFQILVGVDTHGILLKPVIGSDYSLSDHLALYGQLGKTVSLDRLHLYPHNLRLSSYSIGVGLTYRFSLPNSLVH